jgi:hypothetical protein
MRGTAVCPLGSGSWLSTAPTPFYVPTSSAQQCQYPQIFSNALPVRSQPSHFWQFACPLGPVVQNMYKMLPLGHCPSFPHKGCQCYPFICKSSSKYLNAHMYSHIIAFCSTTEPCHQSILLWLFWRWSFSNHLPGLASNQEPPDLSLPSS